MGRLWAGYGRGSAQPRPPGAGITDCQMGANLGEPVLARAGVVGRARLAGTLALQCAGMSGSGGGVGVSGMNGRGNGGGGSRRVVRSLCLFRP